MDKNFNEVKAGDKLYTVSFNKITYEIILREEKVSKVNKINDNIISFETEDGNYLPVSNIFKPNTTQERLVIDTNIFTNKDDALNYCRRLRDTELYILRRKIESIEKQINILLKF